MDFTVGARVWSALSILFRSSTPLSRTPLLSKSLTMYLVRKESVMGSSPSGCEVLAEYGLGERFFNGCVRVPRGLEYFHVFHEVT